MMMMVRGTGTISDVAREAGYRRRRGPQPAIQREAKGRGEDGRLRDRWTTTVASTIAYSMCRSRLSGLFLGFNRQRRRTARERGQGTSLGSFVATSLVGCFSGCTATPVVPRSFDYTSGMANPRQKRKQKSSSHRPVRHAKHAKKNLKKMPRRRYLLEIFTILL